MHAGDLHPDAERLVELAAARFAAEFGRPAEVVSVAPGRVNLIGEHTDYNGGFVLPMAIDRWCVAAGARSAWTRGRVLSADVAESVEYNPRDRDPGTLPRWARYAVGAMWAAWDMSGSREPVGVDAAILSSVPLGRGLSSSAAVELAAAGLVSALAGAALTPEQLSAVAHEAEQKYAGVPCGWMDQTVCALADAGTALLIDCRSMQRRSVRLPDPTDALFVVADSGVRHELAGGEYAQRRAACERAAAALGVNVLREADAATLAARENQLSREELACARHVVGENARVTAFDAALAVGDLAGAGRLMVESHASLRDDFRVSCTELDAMVAAAVAVPGVLGSRMTGGGFGGCTVTMCRPAGVPALCAAVGQVTPPSAAQPFVAHAVCGVRTRRL